MKRVECTLGDGPDVILTLENDFFILYEDPKHQAPPRGDYRHGYVTKGSADLTADEALTLALELTQAANSAKELYHICKDCDKSDKITKECGMPLTEEEMKAINEDYPLESLTCYRCAQRGTCKYVDDLYNTYGDCLADK